MIGGFVGKAWAQYSHSSPVLGQVWGQIERTAGFLEVFVAGERGSAIMRG